MPSSASASFVGPYLLGPRIGQGGFATVYRGEHRENHAPVAIKVLRPEHCKDNAALQGIEREAEILKSLSVPGIPKFILLDRCNTAPAIVMELLQGHSIERFIREGVSFDHVGALVAMIKLVSELHFAQVLHNDLKPENFLIGSNNRVFLIDFGNATWANEKRGFLGKLFRRRRRISGTPAYMAPELVRGDPPSYRSDVYALGACAHFVLTGRPLIEGCGATSKLRKVVNKDKGSISERITRLPRDLVQIIDRACSHDPDARPLDAQAMNHHLKQHFGSGRYRKPAELSQFLHSLKQQEEAANNKNS